MYDASGSVFVGIPRERFYINDFVDNRDRILARLNDLNRLAGVFQAEGHRVDRNRDRIVEDFLASDKNPEWLLMLDSDMEHPVDCAERLTAWAQPIVGALYFHRGNRHDPLLFKRCPPEPDQWGIERPMWEPLRDLTYDFLIKHGIPMRDGSFKIGGPGKAEGALVEVDAVGTGCMVIHRSILEQISRPWFQYRDPSQSEDLEFCWRTKEELGLPVFCDLSTVSGHYRMVAMGQAQFRMVYEARGHALTGYSPQEIATLIARFLDIPEEKALSRVKNYKPAEMHDLWEEHKNDPRAFYKNPEVGTLYLYDLAQWNMSDSFAFFRNTLTKQRNKRVLEIGSGIGTLAMQLAIQRNDVVAVEPNDVLRMFSGHYRWPYIQEKIAGEYGTITFVEDIDETSPDEKFDLVVSTDVFEHLTEEDLSYMIAAISRRLQPGGHLFAHANWGSREAYPFHFPHGDKKYHSILLKNGIKPLDKFWSLKL